MKKFIIAFILLIGMSGAANAAGYPPIFQPPKEYDKPFAGRVLVYPLSKWEVWWRCGIAYACTPIGGDPVSRMKTEKRTCSIIVMKQGTKTGGKVIDKQGYNNLVRHEKGHCNGWPANHPHPIPALD